MGDGVASSGVPATSGDWLAPLLLAVVLALIFLMLHAPGKSRVRETVDQPEPPLVILQRRYALGEVGPDEYERIRAALVRDVSPPSGWRTAPKAVSRLGRVVAVLSLAAGAAHVLAAPEHFAEWWGYGVFFLVVGLAQVVYARMLLRRPRGPRALYAAGLVGTLLLIGVYLLSRTVGIPPIGPTGGAVESVGALDVTVQLLELGASAALLVLLRQGGGVSTRSGANAAAFVPSLRHRRTFLVVAGSSALGLVGALVAFRAGRWPESIRGARTASAAPPVPFSATLAADDALEVQLTASEIDWDLASGRQVRALSYAGQVPGPEIRVREGQRLRVLFTNQLAVPTTIHWHGLDVPNAMDGVSDLTQPAVPPGGSFVYEFDARPAGTRWYHTHVSASEQQDRGLYAPLIVEPAQPEASPPASEHTLVLGAWTTGQGSAVPAPAEVSELGGGTSGMMGGGGMMRGNGMMGGGGMMGSSGDPAYDTFTVNGKAFPATTPITVRPGERVRLRLINASGARTHLIHLDGHQLQVTHTDGNALVQPVSVDVVPLAPAERYDVEFTANKAGVWSLHDLAAGQTEAGLRLQVVYAGHESDLEQPLRSGIAGLTVWSYTMGQGVDRLAAPSGATRTADLTLSGGMMGSQAWTINGKSYPHTDPVSVGQGDLVQLRVVNLSMESHPLHLHGHSFRLVSAGQHGFASPLVKNVVNLLPMEGASIEFVADNPGAWMFHCHKPMHMDGGMATLIRYGAPG